MARKNQILLADRLVKALEQADTNDGDARYNRLFTVFKDGAVRERTEIDNYEHPGLFIPNFVKVDKKLRDRAVVFYDFMDHECYLSLATFSDCWVADDIGTLGVFSKGDTSYADQSKPDFANLDQVWMKDAAPDKNPLHLAVWTETYLDPVWNKWLMTLATPVYANGKYVGVVGNDIFIGEVFTRMATSKLDGSTNFIFNSDGFLIAHPTLQKEISAGSGRLKISELGSNQQVLKDSYAAIKTKSDNFSAPNYAELIDVNSDSIVAVVKLEGPDWYLATVYPKALLREAALNSSQYILIFGMISLFLEIFLLMRLLAARLARPLTSLVNVVERVKLGDLSAKAETGTNDEFQILGHAFNNMTHNLSLSRKENLDALERAEDAARVKSEFVASISHEMRTPLNGILGMTEFLTDSELSDEQRHHANMIYASGNHLLSIINQVLDVSKIEAKKFELEEAHFSFKQMFEEVGAITQFSAREKNLELAFEVSEEASKAVFGDSSRVKQMVINLVGNAIKFSDQGPVKISVAEVSSNVDRAIYRFNIKDRGIGIPLEKQSKLFEPFSQTDVSTARQFGGTGLGLYLVKSFAELMGGTVGVDSQVGRGSEFWFEVSLKNHVAQAPKAIVLEDDESFKLIDKSKPVLIVDDITINQTVTSALVRRLGFSCIVTGDGQSAVDLFEEGKFAFILMDCQMPIMDGYEAAKAIRALEKTDRSIIIALTASTQDRDRDACLAAGMDDVLSKPVKSAIFKEMVRKWLAPTVEDLKNRAS